MQTSEMLNELLAREASKPDYALDISIGQEVRDARMASGKSLRSVARRMKISAVYLSDLERGKRRWSSKIFISAIKKLKI